jgi:predicted metalloprotease with PDZ domain
MGRELAVSDFDIDGVSHHLVLLGDSSQWNQKDAARDLQRIDTIQTRFWGVIPYQHYHHLHALLGGGGGLEHLDSSLMLAGPFRTRSSDSYRSWLGLVSHEFFHTWNVKRLRPIALGPFDYENENYTRSLWVAEGITSYYGQLLLRRAGLIDREQFLESLSKTITSLQTTPGRLVQPLGQASFDAWIKHYRYDESSPNTAVSYYTKGAVVAFLLDTEIRRRTDGGKSLDDLMRLMYERYSGDEGYRPEDFRAAASEVAGSDLSEFFRLAVDSSEELDYGPALRYYGLVDGRSSKGEESEDEGDEGGWIGAVMDGAHIRELRRDTPAYEAGLDVGDELVAIDGYRTSEDIDASLARFRPQQKVTLTVSRRGRLREIEMTLGKHPETEWALRVADDANPVQELHLDQWLREEL